MGNPTDVYKELLRGDNELRLLRGLAQAASNIFNYGKAYASDVINPDFYSQPPKKKPNTELRAWLAKAGLSKSSSE